MSYCKGGGGGFFLTPVLCKKDSFPSTEIKRAIFLPTKRKKEYFSGSRPTNGDNFLVEARAEVELPRPAVKVLRAQLSYDKRRTLHIRSIVL